MMTALEVLAVGNTGGGPQHLVVVEGIVGDHRRSKGNILDFQEDNILEEGGNNCYIVQPQG